MIFQRTFVLVFALFTASTAAELRATRNVQSPPASRALEDYIGCWCPCELADGAEGVLILTKATTAQSAQKQLLNTVDGEQQAEGSSHVLCVDDALSVELNTLGRGTCDEGCFLGDDEMESDEDDLMEYEDADDLEEYEDSEDEDERDDDHM